MMRLMHWFTDRNARSAWSLAFLALFVALLLNLLPAQAGQTAVLASPNSPIDGPRATISPIFSIQETAAKAVSAGGIVSHWRTPLGTGLVVLGVGLVVGGLIYLVRR